MTSENEKGQPASADYPFSECLLESVDRGRDDVDDLATATTTELDRARGEREQRVIAAATHIGAGVEMCAALANDDLAGIDLLATETLHAEALGIGITAVPGRGRAFFMCHFCVPYFWIPVIFTWVYF